VHCNNCKQYRPTSDFKRHPSRPHTWWAYCKPCTRELDRLRYRASVATPDGKRRVMEGRNRRKRRQSAADFRERREFLSGAIELLLRRGLTLSAISRITDTSLANIYKWRAKAIKRPTKAVMARFEQLLLLTMDWPIGAPAFRNRLPHPKEQELIARMAPTIAAYPVRASRWKDGQA
jgi:hypothetical protein